LRARPDPTPLEHLPDASFVGKHLVLPANVRLDWKVMARYKHSSMLFGLVVSNEGKKFDKIDTWYCFDLMAEAVFLNILRVVVVALSFFDPVNRAAMCDLKQEVIIFLLHFRLPFMVSLINGTKQRKPPFGNAL
jgi:hypothetical protein